MTGARQSAGAPVAGLPLAGVRVVELSSFVAAPLCGMTLAQLGAEVLRIDPIGGGPDYGRWPLAADGTSIYWTGLNKGKRSVTVDLRSPAGRDLVRRLVIQGGGILVTNTARDWHSYESLAADRADLIHLQIVGRSDGGAAVDYTVNAGVGFPLVTGPDDHAGPINHVLPAWDVTCGLYAALAVASAVHRRASGGGGARLTLALEDVALATAGNLGLLTEVQVNGTARERIGNDVYGQYGHDFTSADGARFMVVTLTRRHFRDLTTVTGTGPAMAALESALGADFAVEGDRYRHRNLLTALFADWFAAHTAAEITDRLSASSVLFERYRDFAEIAADPRVTANPLFTRLDQPGVGPHLAAGLPIAVDGAHPPAVPASRGGGDTAAVLADLLGLDGAEIAALAAAGTVDPAAAPGTPHPSHPMTGQPQ